MADQKIGMTATEILEMKFDPDDIREEQAFRRGYFSGVDDTIEAVREGISLRRLITYFNGKLWEWRFQGDYSKIIEPPKMPRKTK